ncbi:uncharacterized protein LOC111070084 [Drosophila obscura]|uniref:uncharacterized protein LOC111070084 n=1 Tax=Drosophila obscura TaxID=7282 RepID=UPI001BB2198F|nr:uncharacterized protein LOC111070084 [Drosophila obscura]
MSDKRKKGDRSSRRRDHERNQERNNNMYNRLCQTLAAEHRKLKDLELHRERLMEEMRTLRARFLKENALLRRTVQRGPGLMAVPSHPGGASASASAATAAATAAVTGGSMRSAPRAALPGHGVTRGISVPNRIPVRSVSFANPSPTSSRQRPTVTQQVAPRLSQKREEQKQKQRQEGPSGRKSVRFPKRVPATNLGPNPNPNSRKQPQR